MDDLQLAERLRTDLTRAADTALLVPPELEAVQASATARHRRTLLAGVLTAAAALVLLAGAVAVVARDDGRDRTTTGIQPPPSRPVTTPPSTVSSTVPSTTPSTAPPGQPAGPQTTAATDPGRGDGDTSGLTLRGDGLGPIDFGTPMDEAIAAVAAHLGTGPTPQPETRRPCPGDRWVGAGWDTFATVIWEDLSLDLAGPDASSLRLVGWFALGLGGSAGLATADGPHTGDPVAVWRAAYGSKVEEVPEAPGMFYVHLPEGDIVVNHTDVGGTASAGTLCVP